MFNDSFYNRPMKIPTRDRLTERIGIRLTKAERQRLDRQAKRHQAKLSDYIRYVLLKG